MAKKTKKTAARRLPRLSAKNADKYDLYQRSVQGVEHEVEFLDRIYRAEFKQPPKVLREDFCGTFAICCEWVKTKGRTAIGVDLDPEPLAWGRKNNLAKLDPEAQKRVTLVQADVRSLGTTKADIVAAENFSYWIFKTRDELRRYFTFALKNLKSRGLFVLDLMGGGDCYNEGQKDLRPIGRGRRKFTYVWEQAHYNPITHECTFYISFRFQDRTKMERVFRYDWRMWSIPELREILAEAGFAESHVYWEGTTTTGKGDNKWRKRKDATPDPSWIAYVIGVKR